MTIKKKPKAIDYICNVECARYFCLTSTTALSSVLFVASCFYAYSAENQTQQIVALSVGATQCAAALVAGSIFNGVVQRKREDCLIGYFSDTEDEALAEKYVHATWDRV